MKSFALVSCLFIFLFVVVGNALHLSPLSAFVAALSGVPLSIHAFRRWLSCRTDMRDGVFARGSADHGLRRWTDEQRQYADVLSPLKDSE
jgi:hypothetical protein